MSAETMELLSPYRDRIAQVSEGLEAAFPEDKALMFYAAGMRMGADYLMCAALMDGTKGFTPDGALNELKAYSEYRTDYGRLVGK